MIPKAVVDVGTNSIKLLVAAMRGGKLEVLTDRVEITRLGEGLSETGAISRDAFARSLRAIQRMCGDARDAGADSVSIVGTEGLRRARNAGLFARQVQETCGERIRVISGAEEAELSYRAAKSVVQAPVSKDERLCLFDIGGGSSELVVGGRDGVISAYSLPVGALVLHGRCFAHIDGPVGASTLEEAFSAIRAVFEEQKPLAGLRGPKNLIEVGVGGTVTTMSAVMLGLTDYDSSRVDGCTLSRGEADRQVALYASMSALQRREIAGLPRERADIILAGACILCASMDFCGVGSITVSNRGLRYGVMEQLFAQPRVY